MSITAKIHNISIYKKEQQIALYMVARHNNIFVKLFMIADDANDVYQMTRHNGSIKFDIVVNPSLTSSYKGNAIPFYNVQKYELLLEEEKQDFSEPFYLPNAGPSQQSNPADHKNYSSW